MNLYFVYDFPNWVFAIVTIALYVGFGLAGLAVSRKWVRRLHLIDHSHNDIVSFYLAAVTVFYGITLGLVAIGTWGTFSDVAARVDSEAQVISSIYRDAGSYREPWKTTLRQDIKNYTENVIDVSWPLQRKGQVPNGSGKFLDAFQEHLMAFQPQTFSEQIIQSEMFKQFNVLVEVRRARLNSIQAGLPASLWALVIIGGLICIVVTFFFDTKSYKMHVWMTTMLSVLLGLMIFLIGTLDNPFRGTTSVGPGPLQLVHSQLMQK